jgi:hypothetical protein
MTSKQNESRRTIMKASRTVLGVAATLALATFGGCPFFFVIDDNGVGDVQFNYVLLTSDINNNVRAATSCEELGIDEVRILFGTDDNRDGFLDDFEVDDQASNFCNQLDFDEDGFIDQGEFGFFEGQIFSGFYDLFAIEFLNSAGIQLGWQIDIADNDNQNFTRFSFAGGISIFAGDNNFIPFAGDEETQTQSDELQAFFGF